MESTRYRIELNGAVQGVEFRPFVFRLANTLALNGYVQNSSGQLVIEVEGAVDRVARFIDRLAGERPLSALVTREEVRSLPLTGVSGFTIAGSVDEGIPRAGMLTDLATCADCLREILDPDDRRYGYPFTNCVACGPRFAITQRLPYDRLTTTMRWFEMCAACRAEYDTPSNQYHQNWQTPKQPSTWTSRSTGPPRPSSSPGPPTPTTPGRASAAGRSRPTRSRRRPGGP